MKGRNIMMFVLFEEGHTLQTIGDRFNLSRERVRQILNTFPDFERVNKLRKEKKIKIIRTNTFKQDEADINVK